MSRRRKVRLERDPSRNDRLAYLVLDRPEVLNAIDNELAEDDFRRTQPRFQGENLEANMRIVAKLREIAEEKEVTPAQLALAWVLAQGDDIVPIPGTKRRKYLEENAAAADVELTDEDLARIDRELPAVSGDRYESVGMAGVNL